MENNVNWEPCPRCGSKRVNSQGGCFFFLLGVGITSFSLWLLFIPIIGVPGIIIGLLLMVASPFMRGGLSCKDCNYSWKKKKEKSA